jgi:hypothetical protein
MAEYIQGREPLRWSLILCVWLSVPATAYFLIHQDLVPRVRIVPAEGELSEVTGKLNPATAINNRSYVFWTDGGQKMTIGCEPDSYYAYCLKDISLQQLSQGGVKIKYYSVPNPVWLTAPNIVMSIRFNGVDVVNYRDRSIELQRYLVRRAAAKRSWRFWLSDAFIPGAILLFSFIITYRPSSARR